VQLRVFDHLPVCGGDPEEPRQRVIERKQAVMAHAGQVVGPGTLAGWGVLCHGSRLSGGRSSGAIFSVIFALPPAKAPSLVILGRSSAMEPSPGTPIVKSRRADGAPVYSYVRAPGVPPVGVLRLRGGELPGGEPAREHTHAHDFLVLSYFERGGGSLRLANRQWPLRDGDAFLIAPGEVIAAPADSELDRASGWGVFFAPDVIGSRTPGAVLAWRAHPLLSSFARGAAIGAYRVEVPAAERSTWSQRFSALELELHDRRDGYAEAAVAHLVLLLVSVSRLAADVVGQLRLKDEPLLATVFEFIEQRYDQPISLSDVARHVSLSPGHLTTVVRRRTGRTVQEWITERRMAQARHLLVDTDRTAQEIGRIVGYSDPGYFARTFRRIHDTSPLGWRRASR
jgi:AraC family transcriptional activator of pobA